MTTGKLLALDIGHFEGLGPLGNIAIFADPSVTAAERLVGLISSILALMTIAAGIYFLFRIINTSFKWITGGHDKQAIQDAQKQLSNAILGLLIVVLSYTLVGIVGLFLGFDILNLGQLIIDIGC